MSSWRMRLTVPAGLAAVLLATGGTLSYASAANWTYTNDYEGSCLTASPTTDNVWSAPCNDSLATRNWHWGSVTTDAFGYTFRRLVSNANGDCLTTDSKSLNNAVWTSPCGGSGQQFWNADDHRIMNLYTDQLRTSDNGDAIYSSTAAVTDMIPIERFVWWGAHD
ncbi:hypothetical protein [Streptomyces sp. NPDC020996]|uniref:hypothetical protein n=1 Tax=Streptomyces sp. NPDC020996 TaxID=3154791 RepID=UPI0033C4F4E6